MVWIRSDSRATTAQGACGEVLTSENPSAEIISDHIVRRVILVRSRACDIIVENIETTISKETSSN